MKIAYIAGPYYASTPGLVDANIAAAREVALAVTRKGWGFFCPHLNSAQFERLAPEVPHSFWLEMDMQLLEYCNAIVLCPGWEDSRETLKEIEWALNRGLPVYNFADELP